MASVEHTQGDAAFRRILPVLVLLFVASGCAALIYEVVWFQLLELVIGSSTVSLGILLGTFMGGLCLGSLALPRVVSARLNPFLVYGSLEIGIGVCGIAVLFGLPFVASIYVGHASQGPGGMILRGAICALLLLPPTVLMGATLPAVARWVESSPQGAARLGGLYTANLAGAVFGALLAGFYLLRIHDMAVATYVAVAVNLVLALTAFAVAARTIDVAPPTPEPAKGEPAHASDAWIVYVVTGLSGLTALACQVVWTRVLALLLGATVYTFSIILAVFLAGLGVGGGVGSRLAHTSNRPRLMLALCQLLLIAGVAWAVTAVNASLAYWPIDQTLAKSPWVNFQLDLLRVTWAVFPAACLWGASFPLALASVVAPGEDPGRMTAAIYAANTIGAIIGALLFSIVLVPSIGTFQSQRVVIGICLLSGLLMLFGMLPDRTGAAPPGRETISPRPAMSGALGAAAVAAALAWAMPATPVGLLAFGRELVKLAPVPGVLFAGEGINSTVAVAQIDEGTRSFLVSGRAEASSSPHDMRVQRMLGHLAALVHSKPRSVLIVGFGAGVTAGSFVLYPSVERIVICEIEPLIPKVVSGYFSEQNYGVLKDPRVEVVYDDARHYLLTTRETFDVITSDPIHPWVKGSATLYTREYFELVRKHLNPGGVVTQWVPLYESTVDVVKSQFASFFTAFPQGMIFANAGGAWNSDVVLLGTADPGPITPDRIQQQLDLAEYRRVKDSLAEVDIHQALDLVAAYSGRASDLQNWLKDAQINTDRNLRLQYLAGMGSNAHEAEQIYAEMLQHRQFPENLFVASPPTIDFLRQMISPGY